MPTQTVFTIRARILAITIIAPALIAAVGNYRTAHFQGLTILYPRRWQISTTSPGHLRILSPGIGWEGVGISEGQAEVVLLQVPSLGTLRNQVMSIARLSTVTSARIVRFHSACETMFRATSFGPALPTEDVPVSPGNISNIIYACQLANMRVIINLRFWQNDTRAAFYEETAERIVSSIRQEH